MNIANSLAQLAQNQRTLMSQAVDRAQMRAEKQQTIGDDIIQQQLQNQQQAIAANDASLKMGRIIDTRA